jgi:hypothetical protein
MTSREVLKIKVGSSQIMDLPEAFLDKGTDPWRLGEADARYFLRLQV